MLSLLVLGVLVAADARLPPAAAAAAAVALAGTEGEDQEITTGEYNKRIDAHIALIKLTCSID